ncbi:Pr6Pr family membrane protein [Pseudooceanicola sp.]|uniref:Pr6Pr family membrane protein n=1 Tax=Pseudooceanicola sp. TaxID=1914328 RepID=UPI0035C76FDD
MTLTPLSRALAALIAVLAFAALYLQVLSSQQSNPDEAVLATLWRLGRFFTILTNLLVALTYATIALRGRVSLPVWTGGVTLWIAITGVVYHLLLASPDGAMAGLAWWANVGLHTAVPLAVVIWWLAFAPRTGLGTRAALLWMLWPLIYVLYALGRGQFDGTYPYFFTNPDRLGWIGVAQWTVILAVSFFVAGLVLIAVARLLRR